MAMPSLSAVTPLPEQDLRLAAAELSRRLRAGEPCCAEQMFVRFPELAGHAEAALELIYTEFVVREEIGQQSSLAEWQARFPHLHERLQRLLELHRAMQAGSAAGTPLPGSHTPPLAASVAGSAPPHLGGFEILGEIGRGGMGVVYQARQPGLNRLVALKVILAGEHAGAAERERFRTEAEAAARLQHPNIVQVFEVGSDGDLPFLVLEYVAGTTLAERLRGGPLAAAEAAALVETLAGAVAHAHERGVVHRDLKPANVLLAGGDSAARPKIADFGLAKQMRPDGDGRPRTQTGALLGTPCYMAPEQVEGDPAAVGPGADVYALGAILYELVTGRPPFRGATVLDTLEQVRSQEPVPPRRLQPGLSRDLDTICLTCLRKDSRQRYASARALADDLRRFLDGKPVLARPAGPVERLAKWVRRRPGVAALLAALAALSVAAFAVVTALWLETATALADTEEANLAKDRALDEAVTAKNGEAGQREKTEAALYKNQLLLARSQWQNNQFDKAKATLLACDPARRDREWRYLQRMLHSQLWKRDEPLLGSVAFDAAGKRLAAAGSRGLVVVDIANAGTLLSQPGIFTRVDFHPQKKDHLLAVGTWGALDKKPPPVHAVIVCDATSGARVGGFATDPLWKSYTNLSPRGDAVAVLDGPSGSTKILWKDPFDGRVLHDLGPHRAFELAMFSGNGQRFAVWNSVAETLTTWDEPSHSWLRPISLKALFKDNRFLALRIAINHQGDRVAVGYDTGKVGELVQAHVRVFDPATGEVKLALVAHDNGRLNSVLFCPTGERLATSSDDRTVVLWDLRTGKEQLTFRVDGPYYNVRAFSPDGSRVAVADLKALALWDTTPLGE
jgi:hypothetical protein